MQREREEEDREEMRERGDETKAVCVRERRVRCLQGQPAGRGDAIFRPRDLPLPSFSSLIIY